MSLESKLRSVRTGHKTKQASKVVPTKPKTIEELMERMRVDAIEINRQLLSCPVDMIGRYEVDFHNDMQTIIKILAKDRSAKTPAIKIIAIPPGEEPEKIRRRWIGCIIPLSSCFSMPGHQVGVLGGKPENVGGYEVEFVDALVALRKNDAEAADWWATAFAGRSPTRLSFRRDVCELVEK